MENNKNESSKPHPEHIPVPRRVSTSAQHAYCTMASRMNEKPAETVCSLSLATAGEINECYLWISVPVGNGICNPFVLEDFQNYFERMRRNTVHGYHVADPLRIVPNLEYMWRRMERISDIPDVLARIPISCMTDSFKMEIARKFFGLPAAEANTSGISLTPTNVKHLVLNCNLIVLDSMNLVHKNFTEYLDAEKFLIEKKAKSNSYLIRLSTQSNTSGSGDCTLFTITIILGNVIRHIRFMDAHGVGVYLVTPFPNMEIAVSDLNHKSIMYDCNLRDVLRQVNYQAPPFACIGDVLLLLERRGYIKLGDIVPV
jgi:hypothetical protein